MNPRLFLLFFIVTNSIYAQRCNTLVPYKSGNLWGYSDFEGNIVIKPRFDIAKPFNKGIAKVYNVSDSKSAFQSLIDTLGNVLVPFRYSGVERAVPVYMMDRFIRKNYEALRHAGKLKDVSYLKYEKMVSETNIFKHELYVVKDPVSKKTGLYNSTLKKEVSQCIYDKVDYLTSKNGMHLFKVTCGDMDGIIDHSGSVIEKCVNYQIFMYPHDISDSILIIKNRNDAIEVDIMVSEDVYFDKNHLKMEILWDETTHKKRLRSVNGSITKEVYDELLRYNGSDIYNLFLANKNGKWGIISTDSGRVIVPFLYDTIGEAVFYNKVLSEYSIAVKNNNVWGVITESKDTLVPFIFKDEVRIRLTMLYGFAIVTMPDSVHPFYNYFITTGVYFINAPELSIYNSKTGFKVLPNDIYYQCNEVLGKIIAVMNNENEVDYYVNNRGIRYYK